MAAEGATVWVHDYHLMLLPQLIRKQFPDIPTIAEQGLPGFDVSAWFGVFTTAGTPRPLLRVFFLVLCACGFDAGRVPQDDRAVERGSVRDVEMDAGGPGRAGEVRHRVAAGAGGETN